MEHLTISDKRRQNGVTHHFDNLRRDFLQTAGIDSEEHVFGRADLVLITWRLEPSPFHFPFRFLVLFLMDSTYVGLAVLNRHHSGLFLRYIRFVALPGCAENVAEYSVRQRG
jgi:hypothetical protein